MQIDQFKLKLRAALGPSLENATPANVREFVDNIQRELWRESHPTSENPGSRIPIEISDSKLSSYEEIMRGFFAKAIDSPRDESLIQLWILALDLAYSGIEDMHSGQMSKLFRDVQEDYLGRVNENVDP